MTDTKHAGTPPKYKVAPFSGVVGCGVFQSDFIAVIVPPGLPENLWNESAKVDAVTRRKKYAAEIKQETERIAEVVCDALNSYAALAEENALLRKALGEADLQYIYAALIEANEDMPCKCVGSEDGPCPSCAANHAANAVQTLLKKLAALEVKP